VTPAACRDALGRLTHTSWLLIAQKVARRIPFRPVDVGRLCFLRLDGVPHVRPAMLRGPAAVRPASLVDLDDLTRFHDKRDLFRARFADGDHCVAAIVDGRIVGYEWFCENATHRETAWGYEIVIPRGCVYAYDAYIDPAYRNCGIWLRFKAYLGEWMADRGKRSVLTFVEEGNTASYRTHVRFGFIPSTTVLAVTLFGRTWFRNQATDTRHVASTPVTS
jgi:GNAT superfamily N-acetyltransferase